MPLKVLWAVPLLLLAAVVYLVASALTAPLPPPPHAPTTQHVDFPVTVNEADGRKVVIKEMPKRILATNSGLADVLVDLVPIDRIAGVPTTVKEFGGAAQWYRSHPELTMFEKATAEVICSASWAISALRADADHRAGQ